LEEVFDEVFIDAGEEGEFFDGDEFVFGFAEGFPDFLDEPAGGAASTAGNIFNVFRVEYNTGGDWVVCYFHSWVFYKNVPVFVYS
jgi:hypothetical protein